MREMQMQRLT
jgi:uncharacterized protein (DUF3084 family)